MADQICLLFDMDGTLSDTDALHFKIFQDFMKPYGHEIDEEFYKSRISGKHNPVLFRELLPPHFTFDQIMQAADEKEALFRKVAHETKCLSPITGLVNFLVEAKRDPNVKIALVTNACRQNAEFLLNNLSVVEFFSEVVIGDECSRAKPHPDPYLEAVQRLGGSIKNCVVFEDSPSGIKSGVAAGIKVVAIASSQTHETLQGHGASHVVDDFTTINMDFIRNFLKTE